MKKLGYLFTVFVLAFSTMIAADDLESILGRDDSAMEKALLTKSSKSGKASEAIVDKVVGQVLVKGEDDEAWKQALKGMGIKEGTTVVTMENAQLKVKLPSGTIVDIRPKTQAVFDTLREDPEKKELNETGLKLVAGKIYSNVKKLVESGSKYEVKTKTATAGVRGTQFAVGVEEDGTEGVVVYEGTVAMAPTKGGDPIPVGAGEKLTFSADGVVGEVVKHDEKPPVDIEEEKKPEDKKEEKESSSAAPAASKPAAAGGAGFSMDTGTTISSGVSYSQLKFKPDLPNILGSPFGLGLNITLLQGMKPYTNDIIVKYGPGATDNWYDAISIRYVDFSIPLFGIRYGELGGLSYGQGLLMENYSTFGLSARVSPEILEVKGFVPLSEQPSDILNKGISGVAAARIEAKVPFVPVVPVWLGATYITDTDAKIKEKDIANAAFGGDVFLKISPMIVPYVEYGKYMDRVITTGAAAKVYGSAFAAGIRGNIAIIDYRLEYRSIGDGFKVGLYDPFYENTKNRIVNDTKYVYEMSKSTSYAGIMGVIKGEITAGDISVGAKAVYEDYGTQDGKGLGFGLDGRFQRIKGGIEYKQKNIVFNDKFRAYATKADFNNSDSEFEASDFYKNTYYSGYAVYPLNPGVDLKLSLTKRPGEKEFVTFMTSIVF